MPNRLEIFDKLRAKKQILSEIWPPVTEYTDSLNRKTGRNIIAYYSGFQHRSVQGYVDINDRDMNGFMTTVHGLDCTVGLDLVLHTPGGNPYATEALVSYLYSKFRNDIRVIVPQIAMSAGTMIALASKEIIMGRQSSLGPIDPQYKGWPCEGVLLEFEQARRDILDNPQSAHLWRPILSQYHPTFIGSCHRAIEHAKALARNWLSRNMCYNETTKVVDESRINQILDTLASHEQSKSHSRHFDIGACQEIGLDILSIEAVDEDISGFQDDVLSLHHCCDYILSGFPLTKMIFNHQGNLYFEQVPKPAG